MPADIFETTRRALTVVRRHRDGSLGRVRYGVGNAALRYYLLPVCDQLRHEHPAIELAVGTGNTPEIADLVDAEHDRSRLHGAAGRWQARSKPFISAT